MCRWKMQRHFEQDLELKERDIFCESQLNEVNPQVLVHRIFFSSEGEAGGGGGINAGELT